MSPRTGLAEPSGQTSIKKHGLPSPFGQTDYRGLVLKSAVPGGLLLVSTAGLILISAPALSTDQGRAIVALCAWTHAEWVRIHPFANGNGRTARIWANSIAMRYGLPPFLRLRPRPAGAYGAACAQAMLGNWTATADCFHQLLEGFCREIDSKPSAP